MRGREKKTQSVRTISMKLLIPIGLSLTGLLIILFWGLAENQKLANKYIADTTQLYVDQINRDISQISSDLIWQMKASSESAQIPAAAAPQDGVYYPLWKSLTEQNRQMKIRYTEIQSFYVYGYEADILVTDSGVVFPVSEKTELGECLMKTLRECGNENFQSVQWLLFHTEEGDYIVSCYARKGRVLGCIMNLDTIFAQLEEVISEYQFVPFMEGKDGSVMLPAKDEEEFRDRILKLVEKETPYSYLLGSVGRLNLYVIEGGGILERILNMQIAFVLLSVIFLCVCIAEGYSYYHKIMEPMRRFVQGLDEVNEEQMLHEDGANNLLELESVNGKFRELLRKIQSLKIAIYEKELNEQRVELEYTQEQIKPHFFLNCLSLIHGLADRVGEKDILHITEVLSEYMRYIFKDSGRQRKIADELHHVQTYVDIQKLRYGEDAFSFESILDGDVGECLIPSLLLQVLVENAIVHEVTLDRPIEISLYVTSEDYEGREYLYISVSDTGTGFSEEILEAIQREEPIVYQGRKHVGLQNIRHRLKLIYGEKAELSCSNMDVNYGAVVEVRMPKETSLP